MNNELKMTLANDFAAELFNSLTFSFNSVT